MLEAKEQFDPDRGFCFSTFLYRKIQNRFSTITNPYDSPEARGLIQQDMDDSLIEGAFPSIDAIMDFADIIESLSNEAALVVEWVLEGHSQVYKEGTDSPTKVRTNARKLLLRCGLPWNKTWKVMKELKTAFS